MIVEKLTDLFVATFKESPKEISRLEAHASQRNLYRLQGVSRTVIGVLYSNLEENRTFIALSRHFKKQNLPVPEIFAENLEHGAYLIEDLGDTTLFDLLVETRKQKDPFPKKLEGLFSEALNYLTQFQIVAGKSLDYSKCFSKHFDVEGMIWDMHYFRDSYLKRVGIPFREDGLEKDFRKLAAFLSEADSSNFMYRDFQSRNIMVKDEKLFFIDYQSGRKGALQYDVASLLYQAKAKIPPEARIRLLEGYLAAVERVSTFDRGRFLKYYPGFVLLRMLQVFGTYGSLGLTKGKSTFAESIPFALKNMEHFLHTENVPLELPELLSVLNSIVKNRGLSGEK